MSALCTYLDNQSENDDAFVVSLADTSVTEQNTKKVCLSYFLNSCYICTKQYITESSITHRTFIWQRKQSSVD